jgi:hypothetical protein
VAGDVSLIASGLIFYHVLTSSLQWSNQRHLVLLSQYIYDKYCSSILRVSIFFAPRRNNNVTHSFGGPFCGTSSDDLMMRGYTELPGLAAAKMVCLCNALFEHFR